MPEMEERPKWLKPHYAMHVLANKRDCEFDLGTEDQTLAELLGAIAGLIERNPDNTSWVFIVVNKHVEPDYDRTGEIILR